MVAVSGGLPGVELWNVLHAGAVSALVFKAAFSHQKQADPPPGLDRDVH